MLLLQNGGSSTTVSVWIESDNSPQDRNGVFELFKDCLTMATAQLLQML